MKKNRWAALAAGVGIVVMLLAGMAAFASSPTTSAPAPARTPSPTTNAAPATPTRTPTSAMGSPPACYRVGDHVCGPYSYSKITNSNGYNTYVANQMWGCGDGSCGPETLTAYDPGHWSVTSTQRAGNTAVLTYPHVQQEFNDWNGTGFNGAGTMTDTPVSGLASLVSTYAENMHEHRGTAAQAAYDIWTSSGEIMIWVDTTALRGSGGAQKVDTGTLGGRPFTFYLYEGTLPIIKLDENQRSGRIDILAALRWLQGKRIIAADTRISQIDFGWEICSTGSATETFEVTDYSLTARAR